MLKLVPKFEEINWSPLLTAGIFFQVKATGLFSLRCNMVYFAEASGINEEF